MRKLLTSLLICLINLPLVFGLAAAPQPAAPTTLSAASIRMMAPAVAVAPPSANSADLDGIDDFIASVMTEWKVPGLAIAVVKDGQVILSKGYGYRNVEKQLPVTPRTLFAIGSITKSFTVSVLGMLADEGKLDWDKSVRTYLPDFQLYDPVATEHMTPRDLVTHRSGLPRHDMLWYNTDLNRKQIYDRLRYLEPSKDFRSAYQYNNLMFMTAGILASQVAGAKWEDLVRQRIFKPLDMTRSNFSVNDSQKSDDFALPYTKIKDEVKPVPFHNIDEVGPAGSINSSVEEMIGYVQFHINKGKVGETQFLSENTAEQMQTPQMVIPPSPVQYDELGHAGYGMGFAVSSYRGNKLVEHGGGIDGFISLLSFMPRKKIGMIVLTNLSGTNPVNAIITRNIYDRLLGVDQIDWVGRIRPACCRQAATGEIKKSRGGGQEKELHGSQRRHIAFACAG
jgi:CubicO group peptidase (beta-lactamase class C family)